MASYSWNRAGTRTERRKQPRQGLPIAPWLRRLSQLEVLASSTCPLDMLCKSMSQACRQLPQRSLRACLEGTLLAGWCPWLILLDLGILYQQGTQLE